MSLTTKETLIERQSVRFKFQQVLTLEKGNKLGVKDGEKKTDKPLLALIIGELLSKTSSANGGDSSSNFRSQAMAKDPYGENVGNKATDEAVAPQGEEPQVEEKPSKSQKSLQLKSQKNTPQEPAVETESAHQKQPDQSEENDFIDYDDDFGDDFEEPTDEGIKVSSSDIEPVSEPLLIQI